MTSNNTAHFWKSSYEEFFVGDGDIREVLVEHDTSPLQMTEAVRLENALHNSYKIIEAICGGTLPRSDKKLKNKLIQNGIDPHEYIGYEAFGMLEREQVITKVKKLRRARNDRAAHGRIHENRKITFYELMDLQQMAKHVLTKHLVNLYPELDSIFFLQPTTLDQQETAELSA